MLSVASIVFASAPFFYLLVKAWWQLVLVRFYHGFATAIFIPVARAAIAEHYPSKKGEKISTFTSATIVGRSIAPFLGGFILSITIWDFHALYLAVGFAGITALFTTLLIKENDTTLKVQSSSTLSNSSPKKMKFKTNEWREVIRNGGIVVASVVDAAAYYVYGALEFFLIGYLKDIAMMDASLIGIITGMQIALIPIVSPFMGRLSDRVGRGIPIIIGLTVSGFLLFFIPYTTQFIPLLVISMIYGLGFALVTSSTPALVGDLALKESYGASMGFLATIMDLGQMLGPIITGMILTLLGYYGSFFSLGAILLSFCIFFGIYQKVSLSAGA